MVMLFRFVGLIYFKFIFIIFVALQLFFIGIDTLKYADNFPDSANLIVLFFVYDFLYALNYTLPISIILAAVVCLIVLIKSNQLTAILSIGYSRKRILFPILVISVSLNLFYIALNATPFVYAQENIDNIVFRASINDSKNDILVKYKNNYIFIEKIFPILQQAHNIKIFETNGLIMEKFIQANEAKFDGEYWILKEATINELPKDMEFDKSKIITTKVNDYKILKDFKPKILDTFYQNKPNVSIIDTFNALFLLQEQEFNTQKVRSILYSFIAIPLAIPFTIIIIMFYTPPLARYTNLAKLGFLCVLFALVVWGLFFTFTKLSISGMLYPEAGILLPLLILIIISLFYYRKI